MVPDDLGLGELVPVLEILALILAHVLVALLDHVELALALLGNVVELDLEILVRVDLLASVALLGNQDILDNLDIVGNQGILDNLGTSVDTMAE